MSGRLENDSFKLLDTVVSMNGFHAFPDKQKAFHEIWRVLKPGGDLIACFYIRGKSKRTDWLVKNILAKENGLKEGITHSYNCQIDEIDVEPEVNPVDSFLFVSKIGIEKINKSYFERIINGVLKKGSVLDVEKITREELRKMILRYPTEIEEPLEALKAKIAAKLDVDFKPIKAITENGKDVYTDLSAGFNSRIYFKLLSGEEKNKGIYMIDQPEDHISQKAIKEDVLEQFRNMAKRRQIIMVTHNPQFIVNLDVDNVIFLSKEKEILVQSGALEYEDDVYSVLKIVADNIDGGIYTIQQRVKRYEKNI